MNKIIFFDADGVTIAKREKFFSQRLSEDYGVNPELVIALFRNEYYKCVVGELDLREVLKSYVDKWGWQGTIDELFAYWFGGENKLNAPVIEIIDQLRAKGTRCYLATDQEKYRANYIMKEMGLEKHIDQAFFSCDLRLSKSTKEYWEKVLQTLNIENPSEVLYFDDEQENIEAALNAGVRAHLYTSAEDLKKILEI